MLDTLDKLVGIGVGLVTIIGALIALRRFRIELRPEVFGTLVRTGETAYVLAKARLHNVGLTNLGVEQTVEVEHRGSGIRISSLKETAAQTGSEPEREHLAMYPVFEEYQRLEPGEIIEEERMISIPASGVIALVLELRIVSRGLVRRASSIVPIVDESRDQ